MFVLFFVEPTARIAASADGRQRLSTAVSAVSGGREGLGGAGSGEGGGLAAMVGGVFPQRRSRSESTTKAVAALRKEVQADMADVRPSPSAAVMPLQR